MSESRTIRTLVVINAVVAAICVGATVSGESIHTISKKEVDWTPFLICVGVALILEFALFYFVGRTANSDKTKFLKEDSQEFVEFFERWYKQPGLLYIFCRELNWLNPPRNAPIVSALADKGAHCSIFVHNLEGKAIGSLQRAGVRIHTIPADMKSKTRMSLVVDEDRSEMIRAIKSTDETTTASGDTRKIKVNTSVDRFDCQTIEDLFLSLQRNTDPLPLTGPTTEA